MMEQVRSPMKRVVETVREELQARGWSQDDLARKCGMTAYGMVHLQVEMFFALEDDPHVTMGAELDSYLCQVLGVSKGLFTRLEQGFKDQPDYATLPPAEGAPHE